MRPALSAKASASLVLAAAILSMAAVSYFRVLDHYELSALDMRFRLRGETAVSGDIILVEIGEDAIKRLGRFPFPRSYHAILVRALSQFGAKAVLFDMFFSESEDDDADFEDAVKEAGNVYLPFAFDLEAPGRSGIQTARGYLAESIEGLTASAKGTGHINIIPDPDGKFRRIPPYVRYEGRFYPYISVLLACDYLGIGMDEIRLAPGRYLELRDTKIPLDENSDMLINYSGRWGAVYKHCSYADIMQSFMAPLTGREPALDGDLFRDKICIVGVTATGTVDIHPSPFETLYPGLGIHAETLNAIIEKHFLRQAPKWANLLILAALGLFAALVTARLKPIAALSFLAAAALSFVAAAVILFNTRGVVVDVIYPVLAMAAVYLTSTACRYAAELNRSLILANELGIAKKIQESFLPKALPATGGVSVAASMFTARQVGGDLYDFCEFGPDRLGVMIGDVSGKGVPASLFMAMTAGAFRSLAGAGAPPGGVLAALNSKILKESGSNLFVTMFYAVFDLEKKEAAYANGGHLPALYLASGSAPRFLDVENGAPLGLIEGEYSSGKISFGKGDLFIFYTDGITEAMNRKRETYDRERLAAVAVANRRAAPREILAAIEKDVRTFEPRSGQHDDMTVIVLKIE